MRCIFNARAPGWSGCVSQADTHRVERQNFHRQLRRSVAMATASLPLLSASLCLSHSLTHSASMSLSYSLCASPPPISSLPLSDYLKLISLAANGGVPERLPSAWACPAAALGEMKTDSRWHRGRRDADALTCRPTPTWDAHKHTQGKLSQLTWRLCGHGSVAGQMALAQ